MTLSRVVYSVWLTRRPVFVHENYSNYFSKGVLEDKAVWEAIRRNGGKKLQVCHVIFLYHKSNQ